MDPETERVSEIAPRRATNAKRSGALFEEIVEIGLDVRAAAAERT
jgi:hypothetical protein